MFYVQELKNGCSYNREFPRETSATYNISGEVGVGFCLTAAKFSFLPADGTYEKYTKMIHSIP